MNHGDGAGGFQAAGMVTWICSGHDAYLLGAIVARGLVLR
jgi:hypothetical protein